MKQKTGWFRTSNIYGFLLLKMLWAFLALLLTQAFFLICNTRLFALDGSGEWLGLLWGNIRFGLASVATFMLPYLVMMLLPFDFRWKRGYRFVAEVVLLIPMITALAANLCDCAYFQFTYRRLSSEIFLYLTIGGDMGSLVPHFIADFWYVVLGGIAIIVLYIVFSQQTRLTPRNTYNKHTANDLVGSLASLALIFVLVRGGFGKTIQLSDSARYVQMKNSALVVNSCYSVLRTSLMPDIEDTQWMSDEEALNLYNPVFSRSELLEVINDDLTLWQPGAGLTMSLYDTNGTYSNIVIIMLESFSQEYMGCYNGGREESFTPFLDSLARLSYVYDGRSNGKKSIEALPAVFASLPTWMEKPFSLSRFKDNDVVGLPAILQRYGYHTAFFHGSYNGSMAFDKFCDKIGFQEYYGMDEYVEKHGNAAYDNAWGIFDEPFLQYMAEELGTFKEPFMAGVFTISSHHPYGIPEEHTGEFKKGSHPLLQCVNYSDFALRKFFETCSKQPWYKNTLFVIVADHPGQGLTPEYNGYDGWYRIPMIFFSARDNEWRTHDSIDTQIYGVPFHSDMLAQQIDIMPTILDYIGIGSDDHPVCFGHSLFQNRLDRLNKNWHVVYGNGYHALVTQDADNLRQHKVSAYEGSHTLGSKEDVDYLHAVIQTYNKRMKENRLK